jgi:phage gpG-like protein
MSNNSQFEIEVNSEPVRAQLAKLEGAVVNPEPLLRIAGQHMRGSIDRTFREQGSPAASWAPLARGTLRGRKRLRAPKSGRGLQGLLGGANLNAGGRS